jgi:hypothetical protein
MVADSQKQGRASSGGRRIDDHSFWAGSKGKNSVFPDGPHKTKEESSAMSGGSEMNYEDSTEQIKKMQNMNVAKAKSQQMKPSYRN